MKQIYKVIFILVIVASCWSVTGCQKEKETNQKIKSEQSDTTILSQDSYAIHIGEEKVNYNEVMVYVLLLKQEYEPSLGPKIWDYNADKNESFEDMAKQEIIDQITELKIIRNKAKELGIELDEDEKADALETATEHFNAIALKDKDKYGITLGTLDQVYGDNLLATKVFDIVTANIDTEVSDEEAKQIKIGQILIKTTETDSRGNIIPFTETEKQTALKKARKLLKQAKKTDNFIAFAKENSEEDKVEYTFGKGDMSQMIEEAAFTLKKDQISSIIATDEGYHILYCLNDFDEDATADKKEDIIMERQTKSFQDTYEEWIKDFTVTINKKVWDQVTFKTEE